jgi:hypothetical protein
MCFRFFEQCDEWIPLLSVKNIDAIIPELIWWKVSDQLLFIRLFAELRVDRERIFVFAAR